MTDLPTDVWLTLTPLITTYGLRLIGVIVLLFVAWIVAGMTRRAVARAFAKTEIDATLAKFFSNMARYVVLIVAVMTALSVFGIEMTSFAAVLAAMGFAVGLALQGSLSNFAAGVMLLIFRPFKVGDVVTISGVTGKVNEIELFTTTLDTPDNRRIILPNGNVFGSNIENITFHPTRRVDVAVGTDYSADLRKTREVLESVARRVEGRLADQEPQVYLVELGASSIDWSVRVWSSAADYWAVRERLTHDIKAALDGVGIAIPFPQMDVHLDRAPV
jgi:small conductance mechanosensitive channel